MADVIDTPFGKLVTADWMPENTLLALTPGVKLQVSFPDGSVREYWEREPSGVIIKNIGGTDGTDSNR